jgi:hypothetical protein
MVLGKRLFRVAATAWFAAWASLVVALLCGGEMASAANPPGEPRVFELSGGWIRGSVALGDLNGDQVLDIVVGGIDGKVYAYRGDTGQAIWPEPYDTGNAPIEGKPAIGDIDNDGDNEVIVGVGSTFTPNAPGGVWALDHQGNYLWDYPSYEGFVDPDDIPDGVYGSPALADVDGNDGGKLEIIYGGWDAYVRVLNDDGSLLWEEFVRDTVWSSPAVGDIDRDGKPEIVIGSDAHLEPEFGTIDGGKIYVFNGEDGSIVPGFFKQTDEVIWSSPALGDINGDGWLEIVVGTGDCYEHAACASGGRTHPVTDALYAWDHEGNPLPGWPISLSEYAFGSPALGDLDGDGDLEIVINTNDGYVHAFHADGSVVDGWPSLVTTPVWPEGVVHFSTWASPILADLTGDGNLEVILPSNWEIVVWDRNGNQLTRPFGGWVLDTGYSVGGTPAIGDVDGDGKLELVVGGATWGGCYGAIYVWDFDVLADAPAPWSRFRRNEVSHARYPIPDEFSLSPSSFFVMHEYGSGSFENRSLLIANKGEGEIEWEFTSCPLTVTLGSLTGTVDWTGQTIPITISVSGYETGTYALGNIVLTGTVGSEIVAGSPAEIPVTLYVGHVHRVFLPTVTRNEN